MTLARQASHLYIARGRTFRHVNMKSERLSNGTLRAPTLRRGKTLVVGYSDEMYDELLG